MKIIRTAVVWMSIILLNLNTLPISVQADQSEQELLPETPKVIGDWYSDYFMETQNPERDTLSFDVVSKTNLLSLTYPYWHLLGRTIPILSASKPLVNAALTDLDGEPVHTLTYEVGTKVGFSHFAYESFEYLPNGLPNHIMISYWLDRLLPGMGLLIDRDLQQSAMVAGYGYEVALTEDMIGKRLMLREVHGNFSVLLLVVPAGTLITNEVEGASLLNNGTNVNLSAPPVERYGKVFFPLKDTLNSLAGSYDWDGATRFAAAKVNGNEIEISMLHNYMLVNGETVEPHDPLFQPFVFNDIFYVSLDAIADALELTSTWNSETKTFTITGDIPPKRISDKELHGYQRVKFFMEGQDINVDGFLRNDVAMIPMQDLLTALHPKLNNAISKVQSYYYWKPGSEDLTWSDRPLQDMIDYLTIKYGQPPEYRESICYNISLQGMTNAKLDHFKINIKINEITITDEYIDAKSYVHGTFRIYTAERPEVINDILYVPIIFGMYDSTYNWMIFEPLRWYDIVPATPFSNTKVNIINIADWLEVK